MDIWRAANQLLTRFGVEAEKEAARRAVSAHQSGDRFNFDLWTRITDAVRRLQRTEKGSDEGLN